MVRRQFVPALVSLLIAVTTVAIWKTLKQNEIDQVAQIAETESYAARSRLVRSVDTMLDAIRKVRAYWAMYGHLPQDQWASDAGIELSHFTGIKALIWSDPGRSVRYARTSDNPVLDYRPTDEEWRVYGSALERAGDSNSERILQPLPDEHGDIANEFYVVSADSDDGGVLVAIIDAGQALQGMLADSSPGYSITVSWDERILYERDKPAPRLPPSWQRDGLIKNSLDVLWTVVHAPTAKLANSMHTPAIDAVLVAGLMVAVLMGLLMRENNRARERALEAEFAEMQVTDLNQGLEQQVADRTRELAGRSADLLTITESVGHDLRNPLNSISTNAQLLELKFAGALGDEGLSILRQTGSNVRRMTEILDRLLGFSMISNATFRRQPIDMHRFVSETLEELQTSEPDMPLEFRIGDMPDAQADPTLVRILLMNLLSNALKYSRQQEQRCIEVGAETRDEMPVFFVRDNGRGFDDDVADRLFKAFERLSHGGEADGLGLGLHIAARVVRRHRGVIWAESEPDKGATFYFTLEPAPGSPEDDFFDAG